MIPLIDVHCHLDRTRLRTAEEVLAGARWAGVRCLITASIHPRGWDAVAALAAQYPEVVFAQGVHPWYCDDEAAAALPRLADAAQGAVAIGEIGLDTKTMPFPLDRQLEVFIAQLQTAQRLGLPVNLHCRGAFNEMPRYSASMVRRRGASSTISRGVPSWRISLWRMDWRSVWAAC